MNEDINSVLSQNGIVPEENLDINVSTNNVFVSVIDIQDLTAVEKQCEYVEQLLAVSSLHLLQSAKVCKAYKEKKCGLFYLF